MTSSELDAASDGTARNPAMCALAISVSDPPTQEQGQTIANKLDALIQALDW